MLIDAFEPQGVTRLAVDSIFMMPQLGVLATVHEEAATEVFDRDCLVPLGTCIAPVAAGRVKGALARVTIGLPEGERTLDIEPGQLTRIPLDRDTPASCEIEPAKKVDCGAGPGKALRVEVHGGEVGLLLDGRGRPLVMPEDPGQRVGAIERWIDELDLYPVTQNA